MRRLMGALNNATRVFRRLNLSTSTGEVGPFVIPAKETKSIEADIMNYGSSGIFFSAYNQNGFLLNNGVRIIGPCAAFPRNAFCWNVKDINDVNEDALSLFFILEPRLDVLVIGKGETSVQVNNALVFDVCRKHKLSVEVLPTQVAVGTFNFLNSEGRYVAAALIPPRRMDVYDHADREAGRLLSAEESESTWALLPESKDEPKLLESGSAERLHLHWHQRWFRGLFVTENNLKSTFFKSSLSHRSLPASYFSRLLHPRCAVTVAKSEITNDVVNKPKRIWPRQLTPEVESTTPPRSTSVMASSTAPLIKDFFRGHFHLELLEFPELINKKLVEEVNLLHEKAKHAILQIDSALVDQTNKLTEDVISGLTNHGLFGLQVDGGFGGQGLSNTQAARIWEAIGLDGAAFSLLDAHNSLALKTIIEGGNEEQRRKYLPGLASGKHIAAFCLHELSSGSDLGAMTTRAVQDANGQTYTLSGHKVWITNAAVATHLIVFARVRSSQTAEDNAVKKYAAFIVNRSTPGIQFTDVLDTLGLRGANAANLILDNVKVPASDLLGEVGNGLQIFSTEALWSGCNHCVQLTGRLGLLKEVPFERYLRDSRTLLMHGGSNDLQRLLIGSAGIQHVAPEIQEMVAKLRVFKKHPILILKRVLELRGRRRGWYAHRVGAGPKVTEGGASRALKDHLHPNFAKIATSLAVLCQRFQSISEELLVAHSAAIMDDQMYLVKLADCATDLFLAGVCLGRASRAISIGVHLHDYEIRLATTFAKLACKRIESNLGDFFDLHRDKHRIASELLAHRGYPVSHPLTRVW
ncbi:uncharacterized protein DEA37_0005440 [Paragonimus westermani]|uniref:NADH dehydrogenase [ubiquinone] 1 alpha subcomplex assembly factor 3 n=1 Tax=Paragonimus westermani TaxID=34504 RepID=A0A5J4NT16_9TREM|nr:uncharacterized protein DEA37_0005440 [Paragonimus westermani]